MAVTHEGILPYLPFIKKHFTGEVIDLPDRDPITLKVRDRMMGIFDFLSDEKDTTATANKPEEGVLVIPLRGLLSKFGSWWDWGTEDLAQFIMEAYKDSSIKAIVLQVHSGGGTTHGILPLEAAIRKRTKPVIAAIDSKSFSAAYYLSVLADRVIAIDAMSELGSIGIMSRIFDDRKWMEMNGFKDIDIYPPESNWKNKTVREALKGNYKPMNEEELSPWAIHFQETVRSSRPKLDESIEGILNGRTFYAQDAVKNGLIDDIMPFDDIIQYAFDYTQKEVYQILNN